MTEPRKYVDFTLELRNLELAADAFEVALSSPAVGEPAPVPAPYRYADLEEALGVVEDWIEPDDLIALGERLAERLLPGKIRDRIEHAVRSAGQDGGVRLRLLIRSPRLAQLPWELTYLPLHDGEKDRRHFLALNAQVSIVRHVPLDHPHPAVIGATPGKPRFLLATANAKEYNQLNLKQERYVIEKALSGLTVDGVTIEQEAAVEDATADELTAALLRKADLFHFAGHGEFEEIDVDETGEPLGVGSIVLVKDKATKQAALMDAVQLAANLQQAGVRLAVLGACNSGRHDGKSPWMGVAPALIERGLPAVVAMQYKVQDNHAIAFSQMFYAALATGLSIDEAVSAGRLAMLGIANDTDMDWAIPVLYMRAADGVIFPKEAGRPTETADQIRRAIRQTVGTNRAGGKIIGIKTRRLGGSFSIEQNVDVNEGDLIGVIDDGE